MKKSVFEIIPDYYYLKKESVAIIKDPNMASIFDLDKPVDIDYSEFLKEEFPKGQLIPLELAQKKYVEGKKPKPSAIYKEAVNVDLNGQNYTKVLDDFHKSDKNYKK